MKTLNDYILDTQRREARFCHSRNPSVIPAVTKGTTQNIDDVIQPNYVSAEGIPCHNRATQNFYNNNK